ncbi:MAG TPA: DUF4349 domain-containing protein [Clostridia bacterium]|nr:DUF4349 domain-containing protein [Clostridia bacterium]
MYRKVIGVLTALLLVASMLTACGNSASTSDMATQAAATYASKSSANYGGAVGAVNAEFSEDMAVDTAAASAAPSATSSEAPRAADSLAGGSASTLNMSDAVLAERKMIWTASLSLEVENFDKARNDIESILTGIGFISNTNINTSNVYVDGKLKTIKNGNLVLRVDKDKFSSIINKLYGIGDVSNETTNGEDVTDKFVDIESRLRLLKLEQEKLEAYLAKTEDLNTIFKLETRITDIRYEIESLTGNLNKLSSLVELATINITMSEKYPGSEKKPITFGEELLNSLKDSLKSVVEFLGDFLIFIVAALPVLAVIGLFVLLGIFIYRRIPKKPKGTNPEQVHNTQLIPPASDEQKARNEDDK